MKFGLLTLLDHYPEDCSEQQYSQKLFDEVTYAEALGFDSVRIGEHHFDRCICPAPLIDAGYHSFVDETPERGHRVSAHPYREVLV